MPACSAPGGRRQGDYCTSLEEIHMGLDTHGIRFLLNLRNAAISLGHCAVLGRPGLHVSSAELHHIIHQHDSSLSADRINAIWQNGGDHGFAESFLRYCGATQITCIDASSYEGSSLILNLNDPAPSDLHGRFDSVLDVGTLEHIFNIPMALANSMNILKVGGNLMIFTPCNNCMGHGFYQFSPELFYSLLSQANGFELKSIFCFETYPKAPWYRVTNPGVINARVELVNCLPAYLAVHAIKTSILPTRIPVVMQSDYLTRWATDQKKLLPTEHHIRQQLKAIAPGFFHRFLAMTRNIFRSRFSKPSFEL
jgi:hypothetical protein